MKVACDTSVLVPALTPWHPSHTECLSALERVDAVPAHALAESYSVMTRISGELRVAPGFAADVLTGQPWEVLQLPGADYEDVISAMGRAKRGGGAVYDALIGATAANHSHRLLTRDRRAATSYDAVGVDYELI